MNNREETLENLSNMTTYLDIINRLDTKHKCTRDYAEILKCVADKYKIENTICSTKINKYVICLLR